MSNPETWTPAEGDQTRTLSSSARYRVTEVLSASGEHFVIKSAMDPIQAGDLGNGAAWCRAIGEDYVPRHFDVPEVQSETPGEALDADYVRFSWIEGVHPTEDQLPAMTDRVADIIAELSSIPVQWRGDATNWVQIRRDSKVATSLESLQSRAFSALVSVVLTDEAIAHIKPGVTHGDLNPTKNILIQPNGRFALLDPEFGTHPRRPIFTVPRMLDAAYYYHLLQVQYRQPETAEAFVEALGERFTPDDPDWQQDFWACVAERTLSMYYNFILDPKDDPAIDPRRQDAEAYQQLLHTVAHTLE